MKCGVKCLWRDKMKNKREKIIRAKQRTINNQENFDVP